MLTKASSSSRRRLLRQTPGKRYPDHNSTQTVSPNPLYRFHDIAWVKGRDSDGKGIIAGALENGCLDLWDAEKLLRKDRS